MECGRADTVNCQSSNSLRDEVKHFQNPVLNNRMTTIIISRMRAETLTINTGYGHTRSYQTQNETGVGLNTVERQSYDL